MRSVSACHVPANALPTQRLRVVVKEAGSLPLGSEHAEGFDETVVIAQMRGEAPEAFAERALERFTALARSGRCLGSATLQVGQAHDPSTCALRRSLLETLLKLANSRATATELVVEAPSAAGTEGHAGLLGLVDDLLQLPECATLPLRLRFVEVVEAPSEADSGVFCLPLLR